MKTPQSKTKHAWSLPKPTDKASHRGDVMAAARKRTALELLVATFLLAAGLNHAAASTTHTWSGDAVTTGNWSMSFNWQSSDLPDRSGGETLRFPNGAARTQNTNNFTPTSPAPVVSFDVVNIGSGDYKLYGNPLNLGLLYAGYGSGTNATIYFDVVQGLTVNVVVNHTRLTLAGGLILTNTPLDVVGPGDCVISGIISGDQDVTKPVETSSYGDLIFSGLGANTYTGVTSIEEGTLRLNRYRILPGPTVTSAVAVPGTLSVGTGTNTGTSSLVVLERSHQIADTSRVVIHGTGQLDLNDWDDTIEDLVLRGGTVVTGNGTLTVRSNLNVQAAAGTSVIAGNVEFDSANPHMLYAAPSARLEVPASVGGSAPLTVFGPGEIWLGGSNSFSSKLTVWSGGVVIVGHPKALGVAGPASYTELVSGGTLVLDHTTVSNEVLRVNGSSASTLSALGTNAWWGPLESWNAADLTVDIPSGGMLTLGGELSGAGQGAEPTSFLVKEGPGIMVLAGNQDNSFGPTTVREGTLRLNKTSGLDAVRWLTIGDGAGGAEADVVESLGNEQIADFAQVTISSSGLLDFKGRTEAFNSLFGNGVVDLGSGSLTVSNGAFSGTIRGGRPDLGGCELIKAGTGALTLSGSNTYWGDTIVSGGRLRVDGTIANARITIAPGATLAGDGTVQSIRFSGDGGSLAPGSSAGKLVAQGTVNLSGGTLEVELNGRNPGADYDQLVTDLAPTLGSGASSLSVLPGFIPPIGSTFVIIYNRSGSAVSGTFAGKAQGAKFLADGLLFQISYHGKTDDNVVLTRVAAPAASNFVASASSGQMHLAGQGLAGASYVLEAAPHLNNPIPWQPIGTNLANGSGLIEFTDADMSVNAQRFYRIGSP